MMLNYKDSQLMSLHFNKTMERVLPQAYATLISSVGLIAE